jgi:glycosyltransferase involved in cell wall biosynthesis
VQNTPELEHHLLMAPRPNEPFSAKLLDSFIEVQQLVEGHLPRVRQISHLARTVGPDALIHAHSSYSGAYCAAARTRRVPIVYTPHCYAFERLDVQPWSRLAFKTAERLISGGWAVAACSDRERRLAGRLGASHSVHVPNVPPPSATADRRNSPTATIVGAGRLRSQKDPGWFVAVLREMRRLGQTPTAVWLGGGDATTVAKMRAAGVAVTGWLDRDDALDVLANAGVYLHTARWEGFPVTLLEAVAMGVPSVVRRIPALEGIDHPAGASTPRDAADRILQVLRGDAAEALNSYRASLLRAHSPSAQREALLEIYARAMNQNLTRMQAAQSRWRLAPSTILARGEAFRRRRNVLWDRLRKGVIVEAEQLANSVAITSCHSMFPMSHRALEDPPEPQSPSHLRDAAQAVPLE